MTEARKLEKLDFLVIGAQKGGTTSLWHYLRKHPDIRMPISKEMPFFTQEEPKLGELNAGTRRLAADSPPGSLLGKVTPDYMVGQSGAPVEVVATRIAATLPKVKLIALLRDPIERAVSSYTMAVRRGQEARRLGVALSPLDGVELEDARKRPTPTNTYVVAGEYGRILGYYRALFPADRMLIVYTDDLSRTPATVIDSVLRHLGLPAGFRPDDLETRYFRGGRRKLLGPEAEERLFEFHRREILPHLKGSRVMHRKAFEFFVETWNIAPDDRPPGPSEEVRRQLERHFRRDARRLKELGIGAPWLTRWEHCSPGGPQPG